METADYNTTLTEFAELLVGGKIAPYHKVILEAFECGKSVVIDLVPMRTAPYDHLLRESVIRIIRHDSKRGQ